MSKSFEIGACVEWKMQPFPSVEPIFGKGTIVDLEDMNMPEIYTKELREKEMIAVRTDSGEVVAFSDDCLILLQEEKQICQN